MLSAGYKKAKRIYQWESIRKPIEQTYTGELFIARDGDIVVIDVVE